MANKEFEVEHPEHHQMKIIDTTGNISLPVSISGFIFRKQELTLKNNHLLGNILINLETALLIGTLSYQLGNVMISPSLLRCFQA